MTEKLTCPECGCVCKKCLTSVRSWPNIGDMHLIGADTLHLHQEIESLKRQLLEREYHILKMETSVLNHAEQYPNGEWEHLQQELLICKDKYERLFDSHKKLQKVNQGLEDKLLKLVDKFETEKSALTKDVADLTNRLVEARLSINDLEEQNVQFRNDCNIAIQLLQCKPSNFVSQKLSSFPSDLQDKVKLHFNHRNQRDLHNSRSSPELRTIRVPIPTFPPTAMVYSVNNVPQALENNTSSSSSDNIPDYVSAAILAKVLEERTKERLDKQEQCRICWYRRHCLDHRDKTTQTCWPPVVLDMQSSNHIAPVHLRDRSESSSSIESYGSRIRNGSATSTETII
ncbi:tight junction-associated protein 1 [Trichonephila inaurata madagascariensis]|uniref:Tight junction-associated protein 1 n=1 Tax=Trichonephila inaurata madagascariensis TaxID=2747483 RepID=A0A8X6Y170_9ARAC|nr:tight junction-associated protein 1 [Trichonephila inaurata madagascariensis]